MAVKLKLSYIDEKVKTTGILDNEAGIFDDNNEYNLSEDGLKPPLRDFCRAIKSTYREQMQILMQSYESTEFFPRIKLEIELRLDNKSKLVKKLK